MLQVMTTPPRHDSDGPTLVTGPALPLEAHAAILPDLAEWAGPLLGGHAGTTETLAAMLAHSQHLQRVARAHSEIIAPILNGEGRAALDAAITVRPRPYP